MKAVLWRWGEREDGGREEYRPRMDGDGGIEWYRLRRDEHGRAVRRIVTATGADGALVEVPGPVVLDRAPDDEVPPPSARFFVDRHGLNFRVTFFCDDGCCPDPTGASGPEVTEAFRIHHETLDKIADHGRRKAIIDAAVHTQIDKAAARVRSIVTDSVRRHDEHCSCCAELCAELDDEHHCGDDPPQSHEEIA